MDKGSKFQCHCKNCSGYSMRSNAADSRLVNNSNNKLTNEFCNDVNKRYEYRINTSDLYRTVNLPQRFEQSSIFNGFGYQRKDVHPVFKTTNADYGWLPPNAHTVPHRYYPRAHEFSSLLAKCGMYRNHSLNTSMD